MTGIFGQETINIQQICINYELIMNQRSNDRAKVVT